MKLTKTITILFIAFLFFWAPLKIAKAGTKVLETFAYHYYKSGKINESIKEYKKILAQDPADSRAHYNLGVIYTENKKYKLAIQEFKLAAKEGFSIKKDALYNLVIIYKKYLDDTTNAYKYYEEFKKITPEK